MGLLNRLKDKLVTKPDRKISGEDRGLLVYANTSEVIRAENTLKERGWTIQVKGPPPEIRSGCDLVIEFPLIEELAILRLLEDKGLEPLQVAPVTGPLLEPVDIYQSVDFGEYLMVRAANMKLTIEKATAMIVNVSGGGCPDVPYLAQELIGHRLNDAPSPRQLGHTLCGYALELAYQEIKRRC